MNNVKNALGPSLIWAIAILVTSFVMAQSGFEESTNSTVVLMMVLAATLTLTNTPRSCAVCR